MEKGAKKKRCTEKKKRKKKKVTGGLLGGRKQSGRRITPQANNATEARCAGVPGVGRIAGSNTVGAKVLLDFIAEKQARRAKDLNDERGEFEAEAERNLNGLARRSRVGAKAALELIGRYGGMSDARADIGGAESTSSSGANDRANLRAIESFAGYLDKGAG